MLATGTVAVRAGDQKQYLDYHTVVYIFRFKFNEISPSLIIDEKSAKSNLKEVAANCLVFMHVQIDMAYGLRTQFAHVQKFSILKICL